MAVGVDGRRLHGRVEPGHQRLRLQIERRLHQAGVDPAALPGALPPHDGREDAHGEQGGPVVVDDRRARRPRPRARLAGDGHHPEQRLGQEILAGLVGIRAIRAVARGRRIDQAGLALFQRRIAEPQLLHHARPEVLGHHIGRIDQPQRDLPALGGLEIDGDAALVAVGTQIENALAVVPDVAAGPVALPCPFRILHGDHIGTEIAQHLDAHGAQQKVVEADHTNAAQQVEHAVLGRCTLCDDLPVKHDRRGRVLLFAASDPKK